MSIAIIAIIAVVIVVVVAVVAGVVVARRTADDDLTARVKALAVRARSADLALAEAEAAQVQAEAAWELWGAAAKLLQKDNGNGDNPFKGSRPDKG